MKGQKTLSVKIVVVYFLVSKWVCWCQTIFLCQNRFFGVFLGVKIVFVSVLVSNFVFLLLRHGTSDRGACEKSQIVFNFPFVMCCVLLAKVPFARCADTISLVISPFTWYMHWLYL